MAGVAGNLGRNTSLLQDRDISSEKSDHLLDKLKMKEAQVATVSSAPAIIAIVLLLLSFFQWPYAYYMFMKFIVTSSMVYYGYNWFRVAKRQDLWLWTLGAVAVLFNPIFPIYLHNRTAWGIIDVAVIIFLLFVMGKMTKHVKANDGKEVERITR